MKLQQYRASKEVVIFCDASNKEPFTSWIQTLEKNVRRSIENRVARILIGNYGDFKRIDQNIYELRFCIGPGYRLYFAEDGDTLVILLCGGDKKTQAQDIKKARKYYATYKQITEKNKGRCNE